jgi:hypothetical protein
MRTVQLMKKMSDASKNVFRGTIQIFCYFISQRDTNSEILHIWKICGVLFFHPIFMYFFPFEMIAWGASASGNMSLYFLYH